MAISHRGAESERESVPVRVCVCVCDNLCGRLQRGHIFDISVSETSDPGDRFRRSASFWESTGCPAPLQNHRSLSQPATFTGSLVSLPLNFFHLNQVQFSALQFSLWRSATLVPCNNYRLQRLQAEAPAGS